MSIDGNDGDYSITPDEAFALLGDETRVGILQALWDRFESGTGGNSVPYSTLFDQAAIDDSGNFSYHLEKLIGPFVRKNDDGYELKQTGINIIREVVAGTVIEDPSINYSEVDFDCPICGAPVEVVYDDEVMAAVCTDCDGILRWNETPGILFLGLVPPACIEDRPANSALRAAATYTFYEIASLGDNVCPHCSRRVETAINVCSNHDPGTTTLCPHCGRRHMAEVRIDCSTCKRNVFPPLATIALTHPAVSSFYYDHGIDYRFASWETVLRRTEVGEELLSEQPLRLRLSIPAADDTLQLTLDEEIRVLEITS